MNKSGHATYKGKRPVVIFPEGTKTNGHGVLEIEGDLLKMIVEASE
jgi:1-acyl-sn-glycerol-3-phosphate acyltransferase